MTELSPLDSAPIQQEPIFEIMVRRLREEILRGMHPPGEPLRLKTIAAKFGTSLMPVREALHRLTGDDLIVMQPRRGAVVASLDNRKLKDVFELRKVLLGYAARMGARNLKPHDLVALKAQVSTMSTLLRASTVDLNAYCSSAIEFQRILSSRLGNTLVEHELWRTGNLVRLWVNLVSLDQDVLSRCAQEHSEMLMAAEAGDEKRLEALVLTHVTHVYQALAEILDAS